MQTIIIYLKLMFTLEQSVNKNSIVQIDFVHFSCLKKMYLKIKIKKLIRIVPKVVLRLTDRQHRRRTRIAFSLGFA